ncbi:MAG TPA: hypothetical protein PLJ96_01175, partial [Candidatus Atribacteria bacterium]|nr:hypothetical protein [Candidatus Atribacteria bacterium]
MMRNWLNLVIALVALIISLVLIFQVSGWKTVVVDLEKRVEEVAEEVGELEKVGDSISQVQEKIQSLPADLLDWGERLGKMETFMVETEEKIASLVSTMEEWRGEFTSRDEVVQKVENELINQKKELEEIKNSFISLAEELNKLNIDQRFSIVLDRISEQEAKISASLEELEKMNQLVLEVQSQSLSKVEWENITGPWEERFRKIEEEIDNLESSLGTIQQQSQDLETFKATVESEIKAMEEKIILLEQGLKEAQDSLTEELKKLNIDQRFSIVLGLISEQEATIAASLEELETRVDALEASLQSLREEMENLQTMQAGQSQRLEDAQSRWEKEAALLEERIAVLESREKEAGDTLRLLIQEKEEVDRIVDSLRETISSMEEELKVISSQWESKWEEVGKSITDWQEAVIQDIETKIAIL